MTNKRYDGPSIGERWGCGVSALSGGASFLFLLALDAVGDCAPDTGCTKGFWTNVVLPSVAITAIAFIAVLWTVNAFGNGRNR